MATGTPEGLCRAVRTSPMPPRPMTPCKENAPTLGATGCMGRESHVFDARPKEERGFRQGLQSSSSWKGPASPSYPSTTKV